MPALLLVLCVAVTSVAAQNIRHGTCPKIKTDEDFELRKLCKEKMWFQFERFETAYEKDTRCNALTFHLSETPSTFTNSFVKKSESKRSCDTGVLCFFDKDDSGKLTFKYDAKKAKILENQTVILIKDNYFATYGCKELDCLPGYIAEYAYIYTAEREKLKGKDLKRVYDILEDMDVDTTKLKQTNNDDCHECCDRPVEHVKLVEREPIGYVGHVGPDYIDRHLFTHHPVHEEPSQHPVHHKPIFPPFPFHHGGPPSYDHW